MINASGLQLPKIKPHQARGQLTMRRLAFAIFLSLVACLTIGTMPCDAGSTQPELDAFMRPDGIPFPTDSPYNRDIAMLGKMLFFDPRLSASQSVSCASCHNQSFGWATPVRSISSELQVQNQRHPPPVTNLAWVTPLFWDGRSTTLEEQASGPILNPNEMGSNFDLIIERLSKVSQYREWFTRLFPEHKLSKASIETALATFQRTIVTGLTDFDRWVDGDETAVSAAAKRGFDLFQGRAGCVNCHNTWLFTNNSLNDIGLTSEDLGQGALPDRGPAYNYRFKTPSLRNVTLRAPFMHNGSLPDLESVLRHYARGGAPDLDREVDINPFDLSAQEMQDLLAFLETLTDHNPTVQPPILPPN